ncbi:hypothetical protein TM239_07140 [Bradyrhizobium sp. TM239]|nr:hypothetical protein TM233_51610 [Bradyrhizobium sp. TM233]GMO94884.1 hypothetical protein TM239_07140 [Bradyrhizobium sp. TM239]
MWLDLAATSKKLQPRPTKSPGDISGAFVVSALAARRSYVRVRIRIMKLSKLSSATCIQASESAR